MTAVMLDRSDMGLGTELDPISIRITQHAKTRYLERRGGIFSPQAMDHAEQRLRELLVDASTQRPRVFTRDGEPVRRYTAGGFALVVAANHTALLTIYPFGRSSSSTTKAPRRVARGGTKRGVRRPPTPQQLDWDDLSDALVECGVRW